MESTEKLTAALLAPPGAQTDYKEEWGWQRYLVGGKMYAALCRPGEKYDAAYAGHLLLTLKCEPMTAEFLRAQYPDILPGFYMDKRNWISVRLDGAVPEEELLRLCAEAHALVFRKLTKKAQREILEAAQS